MLEQPTPKSTVFVAALSFMTCLTPDQAAAALRQRLDSLSSSIEQVDAEQARIAAELPRVLLVESEFQRHLLDAERSWTRQLLADLETGRLSWPEDVSRIAQLPTGQETDSDHV